MSEPDPTYPTQMLARQMLDRILTSGLARDATGALVTVEKVCTHSRRRRFADWLRRREHPDRHLSYVSLLDFDADTVKVTFVDNVVPMRRP